MRRLTAELAFVALVAAACGAADSDSKKKANKSPSCSAAGWLFYVAGD